MAVQSTINNVGSGYTYPSTKPIASKAHMTVSLYNLLADTWTLMNVSDYDLINNSAVISRSFDMIDYTKIEIRVGDNPDELLALPSDIEIVAGMKDEIDLVTSDPLYTAILNADENAEKSAESALESKQSANQSYQYAQASAQSASAAEVSANEIKAVSVFDPVEAVPVNTDGSTGTPTVTYDPATGLFHFGIPTGKTGQGISPAGSATVAEMNSLDPVNLEVGLTFIMLDAGTITTGLVPVDVIIDDWVSWNVLGSFTNIGQMQGAKGDQGDQGIQGEDGIQGVPGNDGADGADGNDGSQGIQGEQGLTGADGDQGAQGEDGQRGIDGAQGDTGADGVAATIAVGTVTAVPSGTPPTIVNSGDARDAIFDFELETGADGIQGVPGEQGDTGAAGTGLIFHGYEDPAVVITLTATSIGDAYTANAVGVDSDGLAVAIDDVLVADDLAVPSHWASIGAIKGEKGDTGDTGGTGLPGDDGTDGTNGTNGTGWTSGTYDPLTGIITFVSDDGLGFATEDVRGADGLDGADGGAGADGLGWTDGIYDPATGIVTFTSDDGLGFATSDLRGAQGITGVGASIAVGVVTTGAPGSSVVITDTDPLPESATFNFTIPRGDKGETGSDATVTFASQATVDAGIATDEVLSPATFGGSAQLASKIGATNYATATVGGTLKARLSGTDLFLSIDGTNP